MKRVITMEDLSASPNGKRGGLGKKSAVVKINKQAAMEGEGAGIEKKTASHKVTTGGKSGKEDKATASRVMLEELECDEPMEGEEDSEGEVFSEEERESSGKTSSTASCDISDEEKVRRQIRERNLKRNKMVRTIQDGINTRRELNRMFPNRWIGRGGPVLFPRSPDLTYLDFYL